MGGADDPSNLVYLTVEEHALAHKKLWETYGKIEDKLAWDGLMGLVPKCDIVKEVARKAAIGNKWRLGKYHNELTKAKISKNSASKKAIHTPHGIFESKTAYAKYIGISENTLRTIYNKTLDKPIDSRGKHTLFGKENIGKTPRELGYYYV
jgi:hypothetical protein